jgi:preprotein translocase subunit SecE
MASTNPVQFISQVRAEVAKVVWPTRREVAMTTLMVFILATVASIFFQIVDLLVRWGLNWTLAFFGS